MNLVHPYGVLSLILKRKLCSLLWLPPIRLFCLFRLKADEERLRKEEDKARREFIKQEYLRRKQLKLMQDMDTVIKPRPAGGAKQRRSRPKSIHRDSMDSPKTPVRAATGNHGDDPHSREVKSHPICRICVLLSLCFVPLEKSFTRFLTSPQKSYSCFI